MSQSIPGLMMQPYPWASSPRLRVTFGGVTCMARGASVNGLWTLRFVLLCGACVWVRVSRQPQPPWLWFRVFVFGYGFLLCPKNPG